MPLDIWIAFALAFGLWAVVEDTTLILAGAYAMLGAYVMVSSFTEN
jgi:hypothetical protein